MNNNDYDRKLIERLQNNLGDDFKKTLRDRLYNKKNKSEDEHYCNDKHTCIIPPIYPDKYYFDEMMSIYGKALLYKSYIESILQNDALAVNWKDAYDKIKKIRETI